MRKIIIIPLVLTFLLLSSPSVAQSPFSDLKSDHWSYNYVGDLISKNIIQGYADGTFKPNQPITRAEVSKIVSETIRYIEQNRSTNTQSNVATIVNSSLQAIVQVKESASDKLGAGVFIESDKILTAYHVVKDMKTIQIELSNGKSYIASLVKRDATNDLALLSIKEKAQVNPLQLEDSVKLGESVIKIGHGFREINSISIGVVSKLNYKGLIQTDAGINRGDSGGVLLNNQGKILGIVLMKMEDVKYDNIAWAVRSSVINEFLSY